MGGSGLPKEGRADGATATGGAVEEREGAWMARLSLTDRSSSFADGSSITISVLRYAIKHLPCGLPAEMNRTGALQRTGMGTAGMRFDRCSRDGTSS